MQSFAKGMDSLRSEFIYSVISGVFLCFWCCISFKIASMLWLSTKVAMYCGGAQNKSLLRSEFGVYLCKVHSISALNF